MVNLWRADDEEWVKNQLECPECQGKEFSIRWEYQAKDETRMLLCHDGFGLQYEDAIFKCQKCGKEDLEWDIKPIDVSTKEAKR